LLFVVDFSDQGRLTKEQVEQMVRDAEKYRAEDQGYAAKVKARNALESTAYNVKNSLAEDKIRAKLSAEDVAALRAAVGETTKWIDEHGGEGNQTTREEFEAKLKEFEKVCGPVWQRFLKAEKEHKDSQDNKGEVDLEV